MMMGNIVANQSCLFRRGYNFYLRGLLLRRVARTSGTNCHRITELRPFAQMRQSFRDRI